MLLDPPVATSSCPRCRRPLVTDEPEEPAWCMHCQWNLEAFKPDEHSGWLRRRLKELDHRWGYKLCIALHRSLESKQMVAPGLSRATLLLTAITGALMALMLLLIAFGLYLIVLYPWPAKVIGALIIAVALLLRPRLGRLKPYLDEYDEITREEAPTLFGLIDRVAAAAGTPRPHRVLLGAEWNAWASTVGIKRTRVLILGLPYLRCLRPQERVALLGHEMGHFANGDLRTLVMTRPALETFGILAQLFYPDSGARTYYDSGIESGLFHLADRAIRPLLYVVSHFFFALHLATNMIGARQSQRAEYYADELAARVAGSAAATTELDLLLATGMTTVLGARSRAQEDWREGVELARAELEPRLPRRRQLSLRREASVLATHPPTGLRGAIIAAGPQHGPLVVFTEAEAERMDAELASYEKRYRRTIAHSW